MRDYNINLQDNYVDLQHNYVENQVNCNQITIIQNLKNIYLYIWPTCDFQNARCYFFYLDMGNDEYVDMTLNYSMLTCNLYFLRLATGLYCHATYLCQQTN